MQAIWRAVTRTMTLFLILLMMAMNVASLTLPAVAGALSGVLSRLGVETVIDKRKKAVRTVSRRVATRTARGAVRNVGSMAGEAIPVVGPVVIVGVTAWEIADACDTVKDMEELDRSFGIEPAGDTVCGMEVPGAAEIGREVVLGPGRVWETTRETLPDLGLPPWEEISLSKPWQVLAGDGGPALIVSPHR